AGNISGAANALERALSLDPDNAEILSNLAAVRQDQSQVSEASQLFKSAARANPNSNTAQSNLLMSLNYHSQSPSEIFEAHRRWAVSLNLMVTGSPFPAPGAVWAKKNRSETDRPIRIGYVSGDFRQHSVSYFLEPVLRHHDKEKFDIYCYAAMDSPDSVTTRLKAQSTHWRSIYNLSDTQFATCVVTDEIDILVDLSGHTANNRLPAFARRLAPVQISWLGYPNTTGLTAMDYRLTDCIADPPGSESHHSEKLVRLPNGFLCYQPLNDAPTVSPSPYLQNGCITFGSFNNAAKISPTVVDAWSSILLQIPKSRLFLKARQFSDGVVCSKLTDKFSQIGIDTSRITLKGRTNSPQEHLSLYQNIDIALDTFPYNGTTTTCEAMWMGVPTITLSGNRHASRVGASLLRRVGLENWIAKNTEEYVQIAKRCAIQGNDLSKLRQTLRLTMNKSVLCDANSFTLDLEDAYRSFLSKTSAVK
ncbi:MAG: tetratricopeptide repeat protein, partial [Alphaproteobacteria bacterium]|nr:tetratricopeptide repeat protein [Alphaproteobacteria bacterium]